MFANAQTSATIEIPRLTEQGMLALSPGCHSFMQLAPGPSPRWAATDPAILGQCVK